MDKLPFHPGLFILDNRASIIIARMASGSKVVTIHDYTEEHRKRFNTACAALGMMIVSPCLALSSLNRL